MSLNATTSSDIPMPKSRTDTSGQNFDLMEDIFLPPSETRIDQVIDCVYPDIETTHILSQYNRQIYFSGMGILTALSKEFIVINDTSLE